MGNTPCKRNQSKNLLKLKNNEYFNVENDGKFVNIPKDDIQNCNKWNTLHKDALERTVCLINENQRGRYNERFNQICKLNNELEIKA